RKQCTRARQAPEDRRYYGQAGEPGRCQGTSEGDNLGGLHDAARRRRRIAGCQSSAADVRLAGRGLERLPSATARLAATMSWDVDMGVLGAGGPTPLPRFPRPWRANSAMDDDVPKAKKTGA